MSNLSPMMTQYFQIKKDYEDTLLFFRLGDFYELFFSDAKIASRELEITLTGRDCGQEERAPMCGVPFHSAQTYISRLIQKGYKVAICEQITDPKDSKGLVDRAVVRVVTPGTFNDDNFIDDKSNNYLCSAYITKNGAGISFCDITTGDLFTTQFDNKDFINSILNEVLKYSPSEILFNSNAYLEKKLITTIKDRIFVSFEVIDDDFYTFSNIDEVIEEKFVSFNEKKHELIKNELSYFSLCAILYYIDKTQKTTIRNITTFDYYDKNSCLEINESAKRNLELTETMRDKKRYGSLFGAIDNTQTSMGGRMLKRLITRPLLNELEIEKRLNGVESLIENNIETDTLTYHLKNVRDVERLLSKISLKTVNARDLLSLKESFFSFGPIKESLHSFQNQLLKEMYNSFDDLNDLYSEIQRAIDEDAPLTIREGGMIKDKYCQELDDIRYLSNHGKELLLQLEETERKKTGIKTLRSGYNRVFGYYLEVTKSSIESVPDYFIRKQTLSNCERYITQELKEIEYKLLNASEKSSTMEYELFCILRDKIFDNSERIKNSADIIANLDVIVSFAKTAQQNNYCKPTINTQDIINITDGRHPVVEGVLKDTLFVPNDTKLDQKHNFSIITGPNMAGKSTYMRQVALICLMAQMGSYVPAKSADLCIVDKIFTRVGASDDLAMGQSTFMVEMSEVADILKNATKNSLVILDEIGRGTSTYDGLSIAWAVCEYITDKIKCKTLFATHYHELTELEDKIACVKNYCVAVKKRGDDITFLRRIIEGGADDSYGVEVAKLAGVPNSVIKSAKAILKDLETNNPQYEKIVGGEEIFDDENNFENILKGELMQEISTIDVTTLTPLEALNTLNEIVIKAKKISQ